MHFADGWIALTSSRLLSDDPTTGRPEPNGRPKEWQVNSGTHLNVHTRAVLGRMELMHDGQTLADWRFTAARARGAHALKDAFDQMVHGRSETHAARPAEATRAVTPPPSKTLDEEGGELGTRASWRSLIRLAVFARPYLGVALVGGLLSLASTTAALVPPYLTMPLVDRVLIPRQQGVPVPFSAVWWYLGGLLLAAIVAWLLSWARTWTLAWVSERIAATLRIRTYAHLQSLSLDFFSAKRTGDLMTRVGNDTDRINLFLSVNVITFFSDVLLVVLTALVLVTLNPLLAVVTLVPFPLVVWLVYTVRVKLRRGFSRASIAWADMTSVLADTIPGIRVVKAFAQEHREIERFTMANTRVLEANDRVNVTWSFFGPLVSLFTECGTLVVWAAGAWLVFGGTVTVGGLTAFLAYIARFYVRVESMIHMVPATQRAAASAQRIFDILDCQPTVADPLHPVPLGRVRGRIELSGVHFRYGTREVLHGVDLTIEPGEMVGLVGTSGSGKSTLANLVCRFYDPTSGSIRIDGVDLRNVSVEEYRSNLGCVLQEPFLFFGTIAENIAYGCPDASSTRIVAAARAAGAHEFILSLPAAYDSRIGERGGSLSGGERQRLSIARALLVDPRILILDEATSSVDVETEATIQAAIDHLVTGRTTIAIAHRLSTLRRADRIIVLQDGRIVESGGHDALLARGGVYSRLHRAQNKDAAGPTPVS